MAFSCPKATNTILLIIASSLFFRKSNAQISTPCTSSMISTFTPCLNYVTRSSSTGSSPTEDCCNSLKSLTSQSMDCACLIVTGNVPLSIPFVNRNLAISLPRICKSSVPVQCKASGDPVPAPGPALFGPSAAPTPDSPEASHAAPPPVESVDIEPSSPPELSYVPDANPGMRPVVNPNSTSNRSTILWPHLVLMSLGIMVFKFL
ncbi:hypothetical protein CDL12_21405 [Handroanthus impetiginosus]|uniref:Bifunctional inhibitor/plant lipid transfer protein/seed storage helical domain-containing protein n=1 Tax=Handroanthus impetiginosus TaxID=429701 RepID=A0A2G9GL61_9LAMI|nr:hypothetical protein CDL12_21405 [Handroanthus impetiginosus]